MNYFLKRETEQFGPYSLSDLQHWLAEGRVLAADLVRSEAMTEFVPLSQVVGDIPVPVAAAPCAPGSAFAYGAVPPEPVAAVVSGAYKDGMILVAADSAVLPPYCLQCGQPANSNQVTKTYAWHPRAYYLLIFIALLLYLIVALIVRKKARLTFSLCSDHARSRRRMKWIAALLLLGFLPVGIALIAADFAGSGMLLMIGMLIAGAVFASKASGPLSPERIDAAGGRFRGASVEFLNWIPEGGAFPAASVLGLS